MSVECRNYDPDAKFHRFQVIEFPPLFTGLWCSMDLDVEDDLQKSVYLKTLHDGKLMKLCEAQLLSASQKAFRVTHKDDHTINITFQPSTECISWAKVKKQINDRFVFDLRLLKVDGPRCCNNEFHSEVGRFYISGQYEYCSVTNYPYAINYGDVAVNTMVSKNIIFRNDSTKVCAQMEYCKIFGYKVSPEKFTIEPKSKRTVCVYVQPAGFNIASFLDFRITCVNRHKEIQKDDNSFLPYKVEVNIKVLVKKPSKLIVAESMHHLNERNPNYTYMGKELAIYKKKQVIAAKFLQFTKPTLKKLKEESDIQCNKDKCINRSPLLKTGDICVIKIKKISIYDIHRIIILPFPIEFGEIAPMTEGLEEITISNNTDFDITMNFLQDPHLRYTNDMSDTLTLKILGHNQIKIHIGCVDLNIGRHNGLMHYTIDNKYNVQHPYTINIGDPWLTVKERALKFGMVTAESFVSSVPVRVKNLFNVPVEFIWEATDTPFKIIPASCTIPQKSTRLCDVVYLSTITKSRIFGISLITQVNPIQVNCIDLNIISRKLAIKFWQTSVTFKDIPMNLETTQEIQLENPSRELACFSIVEPLLPGFQIEPMHGELLPKTISTFLIKVKIPCLIEFSFELLVKINNKETIVLTVSGNVMEPKIAISPKYVNLPRIPSNLITYVPVTFHNQGILKSVVTTSILHDKMFDFYVGSGADKQKVTEFSIEAGQTITIYVKICNAYRREYDFFLPVQFNRMLGPPTSDHKTMEFQYYTNDYESDYANFIPANSKIKIKTLKKDISFCRLVGVITIPWITFSLPNFEINYDADSNNQLKFTMTNISRFTFPVTIMSTKLAPHFSLNLEEKVVENIEKTLQETNIKIELNPGDEVALDMKFHPKGYGKFISTAIFYLEKHNSIPYYNLTFTGNRDLPRMIASVPRLIFPPCGTGEELSRLIWLQVEGESKIECFTCCSKESNVAVEFLESKIVTTASDEVLTVVTVKISICGSEKCAETVSLNFEHKSGVGLDFVVSYCFTNCPLTLHATHFIDSDQNPYPFYPEPDEKSLYEYTEECLDFLQKWMYQQGFRRDLNPVIPDTFHVTSPFLTKWAKSQGLSVNFSNFLKRITGPLIKNLPKNVITDVDDSFRSVHDIYETYRSIIHLLKNRGCYLWGLNAKFLLSYDQFKIYCYNVAPKCNEDILLNQELLTNEELFNRLTKQSWMDLILQTYRAFVIESCFFECTCLKRNERDIVGILLHWYNTQIEAQHVNFRGESKNMKVINNLTTDLSDGVAIISAFLNYCPFLRKHFSLFCEIDDTADTEGSIINNACLILEAFSQLRICFPLKSTDFFKPNFLQMLFLSVHLYVSLPMFQPRDTVKLQPPLLKSSQRLLSVSPTVQETVVFNFVILNNNNNSFVVEKILSENGKKINISVKYIANFLSVEKSILLIYGYNKTRIFDTYIVFILEGSVGSLEPFKKCKVTGQLYRPTKVDVSVSSPFRSVATFQMTLTNKEPTIPITFENDESSRFYIQRLSLLDTEVTIAPLPKDNSSEVLEEKVFFQIICLNTQVDCSWVWFRSIVGEFFIKVTSQPRWDLPLETVLLPVHRFQDSCSCIYDCESCSSCFNKSIVMIANKNRQLLKAVRHALMDHASDIMIQHFDNLIESATGRLILLKLLNESGTNMMELSHVFQEEKTYFVTARGLDSDLESVTIPQHSDAMLALPMKIPDEASDGKCSITLTSTCGSDIRVYKVLITEINNEVE